MARKCKTGLDYFPHDCNLDDSINYIVALHKEKGYYLYFKLLENIYSIDGYYCKWDNKNIVLFADKVKMDVAEIKNILNDMIEEGLFDKNLFDTYKVLTSSSILSRYLEATIRRKSVEIINVYILKDNVNILTQYDNILTLNVDISTQSKVEYSKVNESKENKSNLLIEIYPTFSDFWDLYDKKKDKHKAELKWSRLKQEEKESIMLHVPSYKDSVSDIQYLKNPVTYLNGKCWNDEIIITKTQIQDEQQKAINELANIGRERNEQQARLNN